MRGIFSTGYSYINSLKDHLMLLERDVYSSPHVKSFSGSRAVGMGPIFDSQSAKSISSITEKYQTIIDSTKGISSQQMNGCGVPKPRSSRCFQTG